MKASKLKKLVQKAQPAQQDDPWAEVDALREELGLDGLTIVNRPPNSITSTEYARKYGVAITTAKTHLGKAVRAGKMTRQGTHYRFFYVPTAK